MAAPTYFGSASNPSDNGTLNEPTTAAVTPPASMASRDLVFLIGQNGAATTGQMSISNTGGQTWTSRGETAANGVCVQVWTCQFNGTWSADPSIAFAAQTGTIPVTAVMHVFRPGNAGEDWALDQAYSGAGFSAPGAAAFAIPLAGPTTAKDNVVSLAGWLSFDDNTWGNAYVHDVDQQTGTTVTAATAGVAGGTAGSGETNPSQACGQSFTTGSNGFNLDSIMLNISKTGSPTDNFTIELYSGSITGTLIATSDNVGGGSITTNTDVSFNFASKPALSASTKYYFQVKRSGARDGSNYIIPRFSTASALANGGVYTRTNNSWSGESGTNDLRFKVVPQGVTWTTTGGTQYRNVAGTDMSAAFGHCIQATQGVTFNVSRQQATLGGDAGVGFTISMYAAAAGSVGSAAGTSTAQATGSSEARSTAAASGTGTATGIGKSNAEAVGAASGTSTAQATGVAAAPTVGSAAGTSTAQATGISSARSPGSAAGVGTATGVGASTAASTAAASGTGTATGVGKSNAEAVGAAAGTSTAAAVSAYQQAADGSAEGTSTAQAVGASLVYAVGEAHGSSTAQAVGSTDEEVPVPEPVPEVIGGGSFKGKPKARPPQITQHDHTIEKARLQRIADMPPIYIGEHFGEDAIDAEEARRAKARQDDKAKRLILQEFGAIMQAAAEAAAIEAAKAKKLAQEDDAFMMMMAA